MSQATLAAEHQDAGPADDTESRLAEIVVTAQKRAQSLQDVPVSVQVVGGDELRARAETEVSSLERFDPSVRFSEGTQDAQRAIRVRGIGTQSYDRGLEQSVAVAIDGIMSVDSPAALLDFNDIARVEVLRGPQGILFGKNVSAGLVNIVTNNPTRAFEAGFGLTYGSANLFLANGYVSGPIVEDKLMARVAFFRSKRDGILENIYPGGPDMNNRNEWGIRAKLLWEPSSDFSALLTVVHNERSHLCCSAVGQSVVPGGYADTQGAPFGFKNDKIWSLDGSYGTTNLDTVGLEMNYTLPSGATITSVTGYQSSVNSDDFGAINTGGRTFFVKNFGFTNNRQWTSELRFASPSGERVEYIAGLYYYHRDLARDVAQYLDPGVISGLPPRTLGLTSHLTGKVTNQSLAAFGNLTVRLVEGLRISGGARIQRDTASLDSANAIGNTGLFVTELPFGPVGSRLANSKDTGVSWRLTSEYDIAPDAMLYASVGRGYKAPGVNSLVSGLTAVKAIIAPEIPMSYELGLKSELLDRRLRLNTAVFYTKFKDFQAEASVADALGVPTFSLATAGSLVSQGFEVTLNARPVPRFSVDAALSYIDARYKSFTGAACYSGQTAAQGCVNSVQDLSGARTPDVSRWNYSLSGRYDVPLGSDDNNFYVLGSWSWRSSQNPSTNPKTLIQSYGTADLFLGLDLMDGKYTAQFYVKNLFDKFHVASRSTIAVSFSGYSISEYLDYDYKRRFGISLGAKF